MLFSDWDRSGRRDLRVSNDREYYRPPAGAAVADEPVRHPALPRRRGLAAGAHLGHGDCAYDLTGDGYPEVS